MPVNPPGQHQHRGPTRLESLKVAARKLGLNHVLDTLWRQRVSDLRALANDGGPLERRRTMAGHLAMQEAACTLPTLIPPPPTHEPRRIHVLTGRKFWHQSLYCIASLQVVSDTRITPVFYSDGSLTAEVIQRLKHVLPWAEFVDDATIESKLDAALPASRFPTLRERRRDYIHLRKLTDIHVFPGSWKLIADSDLLFFRTPDAMLNWYENPHVMCMTDIVDNYGYPRDYLSAMTGRPLPPRFNVGLYGLKSDAIDWAAVEHWCARQLADYGPSYLQEQGLTAMLAAGQAVNALPEADYLLMPPVKEGRDPRAALHHYVSHSKRSYFQFGWRIVDARLRASTALAAA